MNQMKMKKTTPLKSPIAILLDSRLPLPLSRGLAKGGLGDLILGYIKTDTAPVRIL